MLQTPDLSKEFHPQPKTYKAKKAPKGLKPGKKVMDWNTDREKLKAIFKDAGIVECEAHLDKCLAKRFLGFAHIKRRNNLTAEEIGDPHFVILACQPCHEILDFKMPKQESQTLMETIIKSRGW